jgi:CRISPR-associated protein Cas1
LVIDSPHLEIRNVSSGVAVYRNGVLVSQVPLRLLDRVILQGARNIDSAVLSRIVASGASILLMSGRQSRLLAIVSGPAHSDASIRLGQYQICSDTGLCNRWSRRLIQQKVRGQLANLSRIVELRPDLRHPFFTPILRIKKCLESLLIDHTTDRASLLGIEGAAARSYFEAFSAAFPESLGFSKRTRRPPTDPVNACLSLAYTLLFAEASLVAQSSGLDPALGFYHRPSFGRHSLACDLVEPLRPAADHWVWSMFRSRIVRPEDFRKEFTGCRLAKAGRLRFYGAFEGPVAQLRRQLRRYSALIVRSIRSLTASDPVASDGEHSSFEGLDPMDFDFDEWSQHSVFGEGH